MATINQLLKSPGAFITKLLPYVLELEKSGDPYQVNEAAKIVFDKQLLWGESNLTYSLQSEYPTKNTVPQDRAAAETVLLKNFQFALNSLPMAENNSWLDFQAFIDLFYQILDPIGYFNTTGNPAWYTDMCPPPHPCLNGINFYSHRTGLYKRPQIAGEGTGFYFENVVIGDGVTAQVVNVGFLSPYPVLCPPFPCNPGKALNNRAFVMNVAAATAEDDIIWYDYEGTGVQPVITGNGGPQTYHVVAVDSTDDMDSIKSKTDGVVVGTGRWVLSGSKATCWDSPPPHPPGNQVPCPFKISVYEAGNVGTRFNTVDGTNGYETPDTTMLASDATVIDTGLITDTDWQNAHNTLRVPYEKANFGADYMYLKSLGDLESNVTNRNQYPANYCSPIGSASCTTPNYFLQTPAIAILTQIPINKSVLRDNRAGNKRIPVIG